MVPLPQKVLPSVVLVVVLAVAVLLLPWVVVLAVAVPMRTQCLP